MSIDERRIERARYLEEVRRRHPERKSACGAILSEVVAATSVEDRSKAIWALYMQECRRGLRVLQKVFADAHRELLLCSKDDWTTWSQLRGLRYVALLVIASSDTPPGHAFLCQLLLDSTDADLRGDILEAMAFEKTVYDPQIFFPYLDESKSVEEITSALYALDYKGLRNHEEAILSRIPALLAHPHDYVRYRAVYILSFDPKYERLIRPFLADPAANVVEAVEEVFAGWKSLSLATKGSSAGCT